MWIRDLVSSDDPRTEGTERLDPVAKQRGTRLQFAALDVTSCNLIKNDVATDVFASFFRSERLATLLHHDGESDFAIQFLCQVVGIDHRLVMSDDGVYVQKASLPKEFPRDNRSLERDFVG